jgi:hypothetical protein
MLKQKLIDAEVCLEKTKANALFGWKFQPASNSVFLSHLISSATCQPVSQ